MSSLAYLCIAFLAVWLVLYIYIFILHSRQVRMQRELNQLKKEKQQTAK